jgi:hypothetical protein
MNTEDTWSAAAIGSRMLTGQHPCQAVHGFEG